MFVKYCIPKLPRCFNMIGDTLSGPMALEFFDFLMAFLVCSQVIMIFWSVGFFLIFLSTLLNLLVGLRFEFGVNCLLK